MPNLTPLTGTATSLAQSTTEQRPIIFILLSESWPSLGLSTAALTGLASWAPLVVPFISRGNGIIRPQELSITRPAKGTTINTADGAFIDDFGEGVAMISMAGHTGWDQGGGLGALKLIESMFTEYFRRRDSLRAAGNSADGVQLLYLDSLDFEAFSVYPLEFTASRDRNHPLWVSYSLRMVGRTDLLSVSSLKTGVSGLLGFAKSYGLPALEGLGGLFSSTVSKIESWL